LAILDRFFTRVPKRKSSSISVPWEIPDDRNTDGLLRAYGEVYSLFGIALRIATAVSEVKWRLYKGSERSERSQVSKHPILTLLDYANKFQTGQEIMELTQLHMDLAGKAYWYLPKTGLNVPGEIWVMDPNLVKPIPSKSGFIAGYVYRNGLEQIPFSTNDIIRFPMPDPRNQLGGIGYAQAAAIELDSENYAGIWNRNFFYNSARPDGALETDETLTEEQFEQLKSQWESRHGGISRSHKIAILEGGIKYRQIQVNQKDMDFSQLRKQTRENIMFAFGIPQSVMGVSENVNRANAEAGDYTFARWLIKPRLTRIKNKLNEQLIPMFPQAKGVEIDFDEVVPETIDQKRDLAESGVRAGWLTINEARKMNGFDTAKGGDVFLIPFNMMPTPSDEEIVKPEPPASPPEEAPPEEPKSKGFSEEQKEARWLSYIFKTGRQEIKFQNAFKTLLDEQSDEVISNYINHGEAEFDVDIWNNRFKNVFKVLIGLVYEDACENVKQPDPYALEWIEQRALEMATSINMTTKASLRMALREGIGQGESVSEITRRIKGFFAETYKGRAQKIARTEVIAASNEGALRGYEDAGIEKAEFYAALDERMCPDCESLHGNIYPIEEAHGIIPVHPSCRCTYIPIV